MFVQEVKLDIADTLIYKELAISDVRGLMIMM